MTTITYRLSTGHMVYDFSPPTLRILPEHDDPSAWVEVEHPDFYGPHGWDDSPDFAVDEHVCALCGEPVGFFLWADMDDGYGGIDHLRWNEMFKLITDLPEYQGVYLCENHVPGEPS